MVRVVGVEMPKRKRVEIALTYIQGVGTVTARNILDALKMDKNLKSDLLTESDAANLTSYIQKNYTTEGDLRRKVSGNINRMVSIGCYRGLRHKLGLPVRGQRTKTNARTRKGKRRIIITRKK